jgi:MFS family permease
MATTDTAAGGPAGSTRSLVPARIDRLRWAPFHTRMVMALGAAWIIDGLEITVAGALNPVLQDRAALGMSVTETGLIATVYLVGQVVGALVFGRISDAVGRQRLFMLTLLVYLGGNALTALTWNGETSGLVFLYLTRFVAGAGIGGEYAAINSAIDEMMPAPYRGRVDIGVNGTYWAGSVIATLGTYLLLDTLPVSWSWRAAFLIGPVLGIAILLLRRHLPESPRWLLMHGRAEEAEENIAAIERQVEASGQRLAPVADSEAIEIRPAPAQGYLTLAKVLFRTYPSRAALAATLMVTQSFLYNAIFFTYTTVLTAYYGVAAGSTPLYLIGFALGNLIGPLALGPLFDTWGRKKMISGTYLLSGGLLAVTAVLFNAGVLTATTQTVAWAVIFFFASAGASSGYLTASELFPMEVRAQAIAIFFAIAQLAGAGAPLLFSALIGSLDDPSVTRLFIGYLLGAGVMVAGGVVAAFLAVDAEGRSLEDVTLPLSAVSPASRPSD